METLIRPIRITSGIVYGIALLLFLALLAGGCGHSSRGNPGAFDDQALPRASYKPEKFEEPRRLGSILESPPDAAAIFEKCARENNVPGIAYGLVVDDSLVLSGGFGNINIEDNLPVTTSSLFRIASMTKSFTAMAVMKLRDEGRLSLDDQASRYVPELKRVAYLTEDAPQMTVFNLLTMTSGLPEDNPWGDRLLEISDQDLSDLISGGISFSNVPSYQFEYSNLGYSILGTIISRVSGIPYQVYITESILKPLGMQNTRWEYGEVPDTILALGYRWEDEQWKPEPILHDGAFGAMAGLITSIDDFSKYVSFLLSVWPPQDGPEKGPVKRSSVREMQQMFSPRLYTESNGLDGDPCPLVYGYGYGFRVIRDCDDILEVGHGGGLPGYGSNYMIYPDYGIGIISFSNRTYAGGQLYNSNLEVIKELVEEDLFNPRVLPVSEVLAGMKEKILELIGSWDPEMEKEILADNFYLDRSREDRTEEIEKILSDAGQINSIGKLIPENQLRGAFVLQCENGEVHIHFTLTPERVPKIQEWTFSFNGSESQ